MTRRLIDLWWGRVPARAARLWSALGIVLRDGEYIEAVPVAAALAPPVALLIGLAGGWLHPLTPGLFTTSTLLMVVAIAVGAFSSGVGAWLVLGYAVGDLLASRPAGFTGSATTDVKTYAALILCDVIFAMVVVIIPLTARALAAEVAVRWVPGRGELATVVVAILGGAAMVFAWSQAALVLTRPYFVWNGQSPPLVETNALHLAALLLPLVFAAATAGRALLEARLRGASTPRPAAELRRRRVRLPQPISLLLRVGFAVFLLAGLMDSYVDAILVAVAMAVLLLLREPALRRIETRLVIVLRVPILPRLLVGSVISAVIAIIIVSIFGADGVIRPVVISTLISLVVFSILLPDHILGEHQPGDAPGAQHAVVASPPPPPPPPAPALAQP